jgi:hypothetical protein
MFILIQLSKRRLLLDESGEFFPQIVQLITRQFFKIYLILHSLFDTTQPSALGSSERGHSVSSYDIVPLHLSHGSRSAEVVLQGMGWGGSYR